MKNNKFFKKREFFLPMQTSNLVIFLGIYTSAFAICRRELQGLMKKLQAYEETTMSTMKKTECRHCQPDASAAGKDLIHRSSVLLMILNNVLTSRNISSKTCTMDRIFHNSLKSFKRVFQKLDSKDQRQQLSYKETVLKFF